MPIPKFIHLTASLPPSANPPVREHYGREDEGGSKATARIEPNEWVSVLISSYNTKLVYIRDCLDSIREQKGNFGIELVWINDGSNKLSSNILESELEIFQKTTRFTKIIYHKNQENLGIAASLNIGVQLCNNELILRMDSDDIMFPDRIKRQLVFMREHPDCMMSGTNIQCFRSDIDNPKKRTIIDQTFHPEIITMDWFRKTRSEWFMNHPTMIFRKSAILEVGNYNPELKGTSEDYDLELRVLKKYGRLLNMPNVLLYYRVHEDQTTYDGKSVTPENRAARERMKAAILGR
jgi:glycosyltransferase involved in cell wall biosynthesis